MASSSSCGWQIDGHCRLRRQKDQSTCRCVPVLCRRKGIMRGDKINKYRVNDWFWLSAAAVRQPDDPILGKAIASAPAAAAAVVEAQKRLHLTAPAFSMVSLSSFLPLSLSLPHPPRFPPHTGHSWRSRIRPLYATWVSWLSSNVESCVAVLRTRRPALSGAELMTGAMRVSNERTG